MWQYSSGGSVSGINGRVDMNAAYKDYPQIIKGGEDVDGGSYEQEAEKARQWVMERDISDGTEPQKAATRQEVWVMLYRLEGNE